MFVFPPFVNVDYLTLSDILFFFEVIGNYYPPPDGGGDDGGDGRISSQVKPPIPSRPGMKYPVRTKPSLQSFVSPAVDQ